MNEKQKKIKTLWIKPVKEKVPLPFLPGRPLKFLDGPEEITEREFLKPYWQKRLKKEIEICKAPKQEPRVKKDKKKEVE